MAITLYDSAASERHHADRPHPSIESGTVQGNCDLIMHGKILVHMPSLNQEVWARLVAPGGSSGTGHFDVPRTGAEVLVALMHNEANDAYVLGGLWNTQDKPPISSPTDMFTKRIIRTGATSAVGHKVEFDDAQQSITITTSTEQQIKMEPTKIELSTAGGAVTLTLDLASQTVTIQSLNSIELKALSSISLQATNIDIKGTALTTITGGMVKIN